MAKVTKVDNVTNQFPTFNDIKGWYESNMHPSVIDFDDQKPYDVYSEGRWAGIFQLTSGGAQRLFIKAKPKSVIDIATLTSIYRPGPLAADVDKLYLEAKTGKDFDWGDSRINDVLKDTAGCLIFQEQVMLLAEKCAGFPKDQCDEVRRAIMKRNISGGEAAKKAAEETRASFVAGCVKNGYTEKVANNLYDKILYYAGYGFNKSHAVAYAIDSYWCAWLMTYHEEEWLTAYIESMLGSPEKKAKAFSELKKLGYVIAPIDINHADVSWKILPGKKFMPSLLSCKGVGETAAEEIISMRPYKAFEEVLWNEDGSWKLSKFNRKALEVLVKVGAFDSLDCVGPGKLFSSYKHMYHVVIENFDAIKKTSKKDPGIGRRNFYELIKTLGQNIDDWTRREKVDMQIEAFGSLDVSGLISPQVLSRLDEKGVRSIDDWDKKDIYWFCIQAAHPKKTKTGKQYLMLEAVGPVGKVYRMNAWGWDGIKTFSPYSVVLAEVDRNDFGHSTTLWRVKELT